MASSYGEVDLDRALELAILAVEAAAQVELTHFRRDIQVETKLDRSPVTIADREGEAAIVSLLRAHFPKHDILGEESGAHGDGARYRWIIDPIDGTRGFTRGGSFWGPLLALAEGDHVLVGAMALPALGDVYSAARGRGTRKNGQRVQVSKIADWRDATLSAGELQHLLRVRPSAVSSVLTTAASTRCYGDLAGAAMVIDGRAEAWIEAGVQLWDLAALSVLVEEAGGRFTDFDGRPTAASGCAIASNGLVHEHLLAAFAGDRPHS